jgi:hypothetical protein
MLVAIDAELDLQVSMRLMAGSSAVDIELGRLNANTTSARGPQR